SEQFAERVERQLRKPSRRSILNELKRAEIICTCTTNATPLFELRDLSTNVHINAIGAYRPHTREIASDVRAQAIIVVVSREIAQPQEMTAGNPANCGIPGGHRPPLQCPLLMPV